MEKTSSRAEESYIMWSGEKPDKAVQVIHGKYWQSAHFTKEYIVCLELEVTPAWKKEFIKQNRLFNKQDYQNVPNDAPNWFNPPKKSKIWMKQDDIGCVYYDDNTTGHFFIYEEQL